jgi:hypothetical protein
LAYSARICSGYPRAGDARDTLLTLPDDQRLEVRIPVVWNGNIHLAILAADAFLAVAVAPVAAARVGRGHPFSVTQMALHLPFEHRLEPLAEEVFESALHVFNRLDVAVLELRGTAGPAPRRICRLP